MTVNTSSSKIVYQGNGATTAFSFPFAFPGGLTASQAALDLLVQFTAVGGAVTTVTYGFGAGNYQLTINAATGNNPTSVGGTVTYNPNGQPIPTGSTLTISRVLPVTQQTSLQNQGTLWQQVVEQALDYLAMVEQQITNQQLNAITAPPSDPLGLNYILPTVAARAGQVLGFDSNGNVVTVSTAVPPVSPPPGQQTVTSPWTFTGIPGLIAQGNPPEIRLISTAASAYYAGTLAGGSGTTVTLSTNPTNVLTGAACCNGDQTILGACITVTGGGVVQVAAIGAYNASTKVVTISGNVYNGAGVLIGAAFSPTPAVGYTFTIGRPDGGRLEWIENVLFFTEVTTLLQNPAAGGDPFGSIQEFRRINPLSQENNFVFPITGLGVTNFYISPNSVFNSGPVQTPRTLTIQLLNSSGDTGNSANFPPTFPVTYGYQQVMQFVPAAYSAGVLQTSPFITTAFGTSVGLGTLGFANPDSPLEVRANLSASKPVASLTTIHSVGANGLTNLFNMDAYTGANIINMRSAEGNAGAETATILSRVMGQIAGQGYSGAGYFTGGLININAQENWGAGAHGTLITFQTTPTGSTTIAEAGRFWGSGGFSVGTPVDPGINNIRAAGTITAGSSITATTSVNGQNFVATGVVSVGNFTVGTLPGSLPSGSLAFVTNGGNAPAWGSAVTTGTTPQMVMWNGAAWHVIGV